MHKLSCTECFSEAIGRVSHRGCKPSSTIGPIEILVNSLGNHSSIDAELTMPVINKLHFLLTETIFLVNSHFGLQCLWVVLSKLNYHAFVKITEISNVYVMLEVQTYFLSPMDAIARSISIIKLIIIVWACSNTSAQANKMTDMLMQMKKTKINGTVKIQVRTCQLQLPYRSVDLSAAGLYSMNTAVIFSVFAAPLTSFIMDYLLM